MSYVKLKSSIKNSFLTNNSLCVFGSKFTVNALLKRITHFLMFGSIVFQNRKNVVEKKLFTTF